MNRCGPETISLHSFWVALNLAEAKGKAPDNFDDDKPCTLEVRI
jgi:hypothetical protein